MLEKLVEILVDKYVHPKTAVQKAEDDVKEKIVFLHESLVGCQAAYNIYVADASDENYLAWRYTVTTLVRALEEVGLTLATVAPEAFDPAFDYAVSEAPPSHDELAAMDLKRSIERLKHLRGKSSEAVEGDFQEATAKLREFMNKKMSMGEVHKAQKTFQEWAKP
jgi:hypothetical protein